MVSARNCVQKFIQTLKYANILFNLISTTVNFTGSSQCMGGCRVEQSPYGDHFDRKLAMDRACQQ